MWSLIFNESIGCLTNSLLISLVGGVDDTFVDGTKKILFKIQNIHLSKRQSFILEPTA